MIIISDTIPLSELAKVGQADLLQAVFGQIIIPKEVHIEKCDRGSSSVRAIALPRLTGLMERSRPVLPKAMTLPKLDQLKR